MGTSGLVGVVVIVFAHRSTSSAAATSTSASRRIVSLLPFSQLRPSTEMPGASASTVAFKEQVHAAVAGAEELPVGPVRLELAFVVDPGRN